MRNNKYYDVLLKKVLNETLEDKANEVMEKLKFNKPGSSFDYVEEEMCESCGGEMREGKMCESCGYMKDGEVLEISSDKLEIGKKYKYNPKKFDRLDGKKELTYKGKTNYGSGSQHHHFQDDEFGALMSDDDLIDFDDIDIEEITERLLSKGQKFIAKQAKPHNKIDSKDFEMLRKKNTKRKHDSEIDENFLKRIMGRKEEAPIETPKSEKNQVGFRYDPSDFDPHTMMHRSDMEAMDNEFRKRKESPQPAENQPREKRSTMSPEAEKMDKDWGALGAVMGVDPREAQRLSDMMKGETNEVEFEKEMEEGNAFTDKLRHTPKGGKFKLGNKEYTDNSSLEEEVLYKLQSGKDSELFTESEIVDMIEQIIMEEKDNIKKGKTPAGLEAYEKAHKGSGKENDDYMKEFTKKITEYTKDGSKEKFTTDAKHFPKGNGELEKMSKKAYVMSDNGKEFLEDYMSPGMEDLVPEEIEYDEDWVKDNIKGSSRTGNNPEWANAVETDLGEKLVKKQKAKKFHKAKETAYRKSKQPISDGTGENSGSGVNIKLESVDKKTEKLNEEFNRMKSLIGYSQRTQ